MDHQAFMDSIILDPVSPVFANDANMPDIDLTSEEPSDLNLWNSGGPSSSRHSINNGAHEETKTVHGWSSSLPINGNRGSSTHEMQLETTNMLLESRMEEGRLDASPLENLNLNLNSNQLNGDQSFSQNFNAPQDSIPFVPGSLGSIHVPSSAGSLNWSVSSRDGESLAERRLSCKRKSIEGASAQSSSSRSASVLCHGESSLAQSASAHHRADTTLSISGPSNYPLGTNPPLEQLNPRVASTLNIGASNSYAYNVTGNVVTGNVESSHRNRRIRLNPAELIAPSPNQWGPGNNPLSTQQASNIFIPFNQPVESRVESRAVVASGISNNQTPALSVPPFVQNIHHLPLNAASSSRTRSSSRSPAIAVQRSMAPRNNNLGNSVVPPAEVRHLIQHSQSWSLAPTYQAGTNTRVVQPSVPTLNPHQDTPIQYQLFLPEANRQSLIPSVYSVSSQSRSINAPPQPVVPSNTFHEVRDQGVAVLRGIQQSFRRSANGVFGDPLSLRAARDSRSRVLSEQIRNALARRGDHIQLQGMLLFDHAVIFGRAADLHDRHRDMRLDVDNMSYEELLALEERIGNVNTGLGEEKILKRLRQRKYISLTEEPASEFEPCCICQEEYVELEDVGRLDCGHDFHTACIKQWLMLKNLCPICKTTGLVT